MKASKSRLTLHKLWSEILPPPPLYQIHWSLQWPHTCVNMSWIVIFLQRIRISFVVIFFFFQQKPNPLKKRRWLVKCWSKSYIPRVSVSMSLAKGKSLCFCAHHTPLEAGDKRQPGLSMHSVGQRLPFNPCGQRINQASSAISLLTWLPGLIQEPESCAHSCWAIWKTLWPACGPLGMPMLRCLVFSALQRE